MSDYFKILFEELDKRKGSEEAREYIIVKVVGGKASKLASYDIHTKAGAVDLMRKYDAYRLTRSNWDQYHFAVARISPAITPEES